MQKDGLLLRTFKDGQAKLNAYQEDYACLIDGLISLYEATGSIHWLEHAIRFSDTMIDQFWDDENGGWYFTGKSHEQLIVRSKDFMDNATPSGNSVGALALQRLAILAGKEQYQRHATTILRLVADQIKRYPSAFGCTLCGLDFYLSTPKEIAVVAEGRSKALTELLRVIWQTYLPNRVIACCLENHEIAARIVPLFQERPPKERPQAFVCEAYTCQEPTSSATRLLSHLAIPSA